MKKVIAGFFVVLLFLYGLTWAAKAYFDSTGFRQPLAKDNRGVSSMAKVESRDFYVLNSQSSWQQTFLAGVDIGLGAPGAFPGDFAIDYDTYLDWFTQIGAMGSNVVRVYTLQAPAFYQALYEYNHVALTPLYLVQGIYMDEADVAQYGDVFDSRSTTAADMRKDIMDCVNILHGDANIAPSAGKASGRYRYDVSSYVIGWILGIECEAYLVEGTNKAHPDITSFERQYVYTENASPFEVFIAQMSELAIGYETEHYGMQRPVAFCNWITTDPLTHPNEPRPTEDSASIDVEHIKATERFAPGFFASYHVYPYYPDFLNFPSGDASVDANPYYAYVQSLVDYHSMPVLISEFGLPTSRGVTHINALTGLNQGGNTEAQQGAGLVSMLSDIHRAGCMGGIVFAWQDEWFKTSWNTMDLDDSSARPKWHNTESSEENFGLLGFSAFSSIRIDGDDSDWASVSPLSGSDIKAGWDAAYLYLRVPVGDLDKQTYYIPIDTIEGEGSTYYQGLKFDRAADFMLVLDGRANTRLLIDPYYDPNAKLYGTRFYSADELAGYAASDSGRFMSIQQVLSDRMLMPKTGQIVPVQLWDTGKMRYGNSNPADAAYDSMADFCSGSGFTELRIPWMLLNFADPSSGKILSNLHSETAIGFEKIASLYVGFAPKGDTATVAMAPCTLPSWTTVPYSQRLKQSYYMLQKVFPQYATSPAATGTIDAHAIRLGNIRLFFAHLDRQVRKVDLITWLVLLSILISIYLFIVLLAVNIRLNRLAKRRVRERAHLLSLQSLPAEEIQKKLHYRYLCSSRGAHLLCRVLMTDCPYGGNTGLWNALRTGRYMRWMRRVLGQRNLMRRILIVRLTGLLRISEFEDQIIPLMRAHPENLELQYAGFLALSMMGNRNSILELCGDPKFSKRLSYRSLKEICSVYTGDKDSLYREMLHATDRYIRSIIVKDIGTENLPAFAPLLLPLLEETDEILLTDVIRTLGQLRSTAAGPRIATFIQRENWTVRNATVVALAQIDAKAYRPELVQGLRDKEWWVRYNSAKGLCAHMPQAALEEMLNTLHDRYAVDILRFALEEAQLMGKGAKRA